MKIPFASLLILGAWLLTPSAASSAAFRNPYGRLPADATPGDRLFAEYFREETQRLRQADLAEIHTLEDWTARRESMRSNLFEMLGLQPEPPRTDLKATVTGVLDQPDFTVEKLHFQSVPGLYVTANLYLPKGQTAPAPAILYSCGHGMVKSNGVSYGNKVYYQHHGIAFARQGYVCLVLDTVQLGEIEGLHHGTAREGMWWWNSRGYTPAGVEAWNGIRALDYLETRPEVDKTRFGATGRSGGGAYTWWVAALDDRIRVACPVAGMTDLENYVVDGTIEGHCDCMFPVNTYRWDFPRIASLIAPRPLLIGNTDKDTIFPLDGVQRLHEKVRRTYDLFGASDRLGLLITEGPHKDTQDLQVPVMRWFNRFLKKEEGMVDVAIPARFRPEQLKVFETLPPDEITRRCQEQFTRLASGQGDFDAARSVAELKQKTFGGWPTGLRDPGIRTVASQELEGVRLNVYEFESQPGVKLRLYAVGPSGGPVREIQLRIVDEPSWTAQLGLGRIGFMSLLKDECERAGVRADAPVPEEDARAFQALMTAFRENQTVYCTLTPRGVGLTRPGGDSKSLTLLRRRFMLIGQTLAGMQAWDLRRAIQGVRSIEGYASLPLHVAAEPALTEVALFATLFESGVSSLTLPFAARRDLDAPDFLNWSRIVTPEQLMILVQRNCRVKVEPAK